MKDNRFSTLGLSFLWLVAFLSLWFLLNAIFSVPSYQEQGFPSIVITAWVAIPAGLLISMVAILMQRKVGGYGLVVTLILMIPTTVAINYYALLPDQPEELTGGWFVTSTIIIGILAAIIGVPVFLAIRKQWPAFQ